MHWFALNKCINQLAHLQQEYIRNLPPVVFVLVFCCAMEFRWQKRMLLQTIQIKHNETQDTTNAKDVQGYNVFNNFFM